MRDAVPLGLIAALTLLGGPALARADVEAEAPGPRFDGWASGDDPAWIPGLFIGIGVSVQGVEGSNDNALREPIAGDVTYATALADFGAHLYAPPLEALPGAPRPFLHGAYQHWPDPDERIVREGDPEPRATPPGSIGPGTSAEEFAGQGTQVSWDVGGSWYAGLGLSWLVPIDWFERNIQLRASVDYFGETGDAKSLLTDVSGPDGGPFTETNLQGSAPLTLHGVGPRIQVETYLARRGPFGLSAYAGAQFYWLVGNREVAFTASDGVSSMDVLVRSDPLVAQGGVGVRIHWLGSVGGGG